MPGAFEPACPAGGCVRGLPTIVRVGKGAIRQEYVTIAVPLS